MVYLLDSNPCIVSLNEVNSSVARKIAVMPAEHISLCTIVQIEFDYGAYRSSKPVQVGWAIALSLPTIWSHVGGQLNTCSPYTG